MNILFLCTSNVNRSRTAEDYFSQLLPKHDYKSAGLSTKYCAQYSTTLCTTQLLDWADKVFVMDDFHADRIRKYAGEQYLQKVTVLSIPDEYCYGDETLQQRLHEVLSDYI